MHAYRFRINSDDNDEFLRIIDVLANQTFEDFHNALVKTCRFKSRELASFFLCNNEWHKKQEITLLDMNIEMEESEEDEDDSEKNSPKVLIMKDHKLNQIIDDPHQKILYVFDFLKMITLNMELIKVVDTDEMIEYPHIVEKQSELHLSSKENLDMMSDDLLISSDDLSDFNDITPDIE